MMEVVWVGGSGHCCDEFQVGIEPEGGKSTGGGGRRSQSTKGSGGLGTGRLFGRIEVFKGKKE